MNQKLYKIVLKGCREIVNGINLHESYVVAESTDAAYAKLRDQLEKEGIGTPDERELQMLYLLAEDDPFAKIGTRLFL